MSDFLTRDGSREPDILRCGCELMYRTSEHGEHRVSLIFLTPCSEEHRYVAENVRGRGGVATSSLVVKAVKR